MAHRKTDAELGAEFAELAVRCHMDAYKAQMRPVKDEDLVGDVASLAPAGSTARIQPPATLFPDWKGGYVLIPFESVFATDQMHDLWEKIDASAAAADEMVKVVEHEFRAMCAEQPGLMIEGEATFLKMVETIAQGRLIRGLGDFVDATKDGGEDSIYEAEFIDVSPRGDMIPQLFFLSRDDDYEEFKIKLSVLCKPSFAADDRGPLDNLKARVQCVAEDARHWKITARLKQCGVIVESYCKPHGFLDHGMWLYKLSSSSIPHISADAWGRINNQRDYEVAMKELEDRLEEDEGGNIRMILIRPWQKRFFTLCDEVANIEKWNDSELVKQSMQSVNQEMPRLTLAAGPPDGAGADESRHPSDEIYDEFLDDASQSEAPLPSTDIGNGGECT